MSDSPMRILVIDDDPGDVALLERFLQEMSKDAVALTHATSGTTGLRELAKNQFDVAFLDYRLGDASGEAVLTEIRNDGCDVAIVMLTGQGNEQVVANLLRIGADDYLAKQDMNSLSLQRAIRNARTCRDKRKIESELSEKNVLLAAALARAESASVAKTQFVANVSHELRSPLTAILGFTEMLLEKPFEDESRELIQVIQRNGSFLLELINEILDLAKIESGQLEIELVSTRVDKMVNELMALLRPRAARKQIVFESRGSSSITHPVSLDAKRVQQILLNLLTNAIKFTETGSVVLETSLIRGARNDDAPSGSPTKDHVEFAVSDSGIGISENQLLRIFEPFAQADASTTRQFGGTGLGLTICKKLATLLGGEIEVESQVGKGSTFRVRIPVTDAPVSMQAPSASHQAWPTHENHALASSNILAGVRVLVAEDGPDNQRLIRHFLEGAGADTAIFENGQLAVEAARAAHASGEPFDIVLMDIQMPVMDGYAALESLRESEIDVPVIALTANALSTDREKCFRAGFNAFVCKPIDRAQFLQSISLLLQSEEVPSCPSRS